MRKVTKLPPPAYFWVTNVSNRNVSLTDLALSIKAFTTVNLLDSRHYSLTKEQLEKSATSGSLFLKRRMLKVRNVPPVVQESLNTIHMNPESVIPGRERSTLNIKQEHYEELNVLEQKEDEEKFAADNAELAELDALPLITKRQ